MLLAAFFLLLGLLSIIFASLLTLLGGTALDINTILGAGILVLGAIGLTVAAILYDRS